MNPNARMVYRVSDDLRTLRVHPSLHEREMELAPLFDRISSPTASIHEKFATFHSAAIDPHGVPVHLYEQCKD
ncbi:MAG: glucuronosyltransferase, partial [Gammaproteobacteria bacterium]|nr:glucuronosyltransferase [Gammaproteobacteria bacterium]